MEEVVGSIPTRSTKSLNNLDGAGAFSNGASIWLLLFGFAIGIAGANYLAPSASMPRDPARESALSLAVEAVTFGAPDLPSAEQLPAAMAVSGVDS